MKAVHVVRHVWRVGLGLFLLLGGMGGAVAAQGPTPTPVSAVLATVTVERAMSSPARNALPIR